MYKTPNFLEQEMLERCAAFHVWLALFLPLSCSFCEWMASVFHRHKSEACTSFDPSSEAMGMIAIPRNLWINCHIEITCSAHHWSGIIANEGLKAN